VLEEREFMRVGGSQSIRVDVRVLAATNADLERLVEEGGFRRDLYFRLKVVTLAVPPLRERREDLPVLVPQLVDQIARANNLAPRRTTGAAMQALQDYHWPGNVRELLNLIENLLVSTTGDVIDLPDLPPAVQGAVASGTDSSFPGLGPGPAPGYTMQEMERELIRKTLESTGGNRTRTAKALRIGVRTLQRKIARYRLGAN
jgi:DNA-binding NtrC family response regulator